jgi:hypothetical protein
MTLFSSIRSTLAQVPQKMMSDLIWVIVFFVFVLVVENFLVLLWANAVKGMPIEQTQASYSIAGVYSMAMLCSGAASFVGGLIGFLFGIPQSNGTSQRTSRSIGLQRDTEETDSSRHQTQESVQVTAEGAAATGAQTVPAAGLHRNTNLENISDALTKGLLAIGASQLFKLSDWVNDIGAGVGTSFGPGTAGKIIALSVLTYGTVAGFLFGYLATRIYLTGVFQRNDPQM